MTYFAMPHVLRSLTTCDPTPMLRWVELGNGLGSDAARRLEQLCIVKDYDAAGNVTNVRQEWRAVPTEDGR